MSLMVVFSEQFLKQISFVKVFVPSDDDDGCLTVIGLQIQNADP